MGIRGEPSIPEMGDFQIHNCWIPDTPGKPILAKPQPICGDNGKNQVNGMYTNSSEGQKGSHDWEIYLREKTVQDGVAATATTRQGNVNAASSSSESIFKTGFEGTRFEASFTNSLPDNKFISVGPNLWVNSSCLPNTPIHGNSIPSRHNYDLNSPSKGLTDAFSSGNMYFQFAPITPDQSRKEENKQGKEVSTRDGSDDIHHDQEKQLLNDSSSTAVSTQVQENHNPDTDLQKTPQQKSRRKKHRPKVVREGKQKRTRRPATPKSVENKETPTGKRKYVRKNKVQETPGLPTVEVTPSAENKESPTGKRKYVRKKGVNKTQGLPKVEVTSKCTDTKTELHKEKSCRKRLNFDDNSPTIEESFPCRPESNGNGESQAQNFHIRVEPEPTVQLGQASELMAEKTKAHLANDCPKAHEQNECKRGKCRIVFSNQTHDKQESSVQLMMKNNAQAAPSLNDTNCSTEAGLCEGEAARGLKRGHECTKNEAEPRCTSATGGGYNSVRRGNDPTIDETEPRCTNAIGGCYNSVHEYLAVLPAEVYDDTRISGMHFSATDKKKRMKRRHSTTASSTSSSETAAENNVKEATACTFNNARVASYTPDTNFTNSAAQFNTTSIQTKTSLLLNLQLQQQVFACKMALNQKRRMKEMGSNKATGACSLASLVGSELALDQTRRMTEMRSNIATQVCSLASLVGSELALDQTRMKTQMISNIATQVYSLASLIGTVECNQVPISSAEGASLCGDLQMCVSSHPHHACVERMVPKTHTTRRKKRTKRNPAANEVSTDATQKEIPTVDVITECLKHLHISPKYNRQNALVLYHRVGTVVPSEDSFQPIRKRRPRAKVDIDTETNRVWRLLLENINNEGIDGTDEEKAKWWEEERRVFQGRADSFIARMHLVQGDRRFTPWKGSVVDSVVGVFLTQNVSDHLSSSAFMSLAAHFPFKTKGGFCPCSKETSILVKEPEAHILEPADTINRHQEKLNQTAQNTSSIAIQVTDTMVGKGVVNHNDFPESSSNDGNSTAELKNEPSYSSRNDPEMFLNSTANKGAFQQTEAVANFRGEMSDILSSKHSTGNSQNCEDSSMAPNGKQIGSYLQEKSEDMQVIRSNPSFMELLHMAVRGFPNQETEGISSYKENEQDYMNESEDATQNFNHRSYSPKTSIRPIIPSTIPDLRELEVPSYEMLGEETPSSNAPNGHEENSASEQSEVTVESVSQAIVQKVLNVSFQEASKSADDINHACSSLQRESNTIFESEYRPLRDPKDILQVQTEVLNYRMQQEAEAINLSKESLAVNSCTIDNPKNTEHTVIESSFEGHGPNPGSASATSELKRGRAGKQKENPVDWDILRLQAQEKGKRERTTNTMDSLDWEAVWQADVDEVANTIKARGMNNVLAGRIKDFLNRLVREHGSIDLEWLRDVPPDKAKEYLLSVRGLGLKSVECVRLLTLHHLAFPVDTNVGRIAVRLGWVPLQPLPESLQLHLLELYPVLESIQQYLWPRLCKLDQRTLYELHYQMITFGKVFCTKSKPNCNACPMRGECRHFASAFASARLALPGTEEKSIMNATEPKEAKQSPVEAIKPLQLPLPQPNLQLQAHSQVHTCQPIVEVPTTPIVEEPIVEVPTTPEPELQAPESDIEDAFLEDPEDIPTIKLNIEEFTQNLQNYMEQNMELQDGDMSKALIALTQEAASIPMPKLKNVSQLRTEHQVYELPDSHPLLEGLDRREPDDPCSYLLAIWTPGETASSINQPENRCSYQESGELCDEKTCFSCNSIREANSQTVRGTLLIPCRTAMRGSFPLNGTYFQVNEVFADHDSSINPIDVPRAWIWNLPRRIVYFGTSIPTIFKGLSTESIQYCFWRGFVCVRGFDQKTRAPRPLMARLHFPASKLPRTSGKTDEKKD